MRCFDQIPLCRFRGEKPAPRGAIRDNKFRPYGIEKGKGFVRAEIAQTVGGEIASLVCSAKRHTWGLPVHAQRSARRIFPSFRGTLFQVQGLNTALSRPKIRNV